MNFKIFLVLFILSGYSNGQRDKKFFRKDYKYIEATDSFYKIHTIHRTWPDAKRMCALEGASLFYPENTEEAQAVGAYWTQAQNYHWIYIGVSALVAKGVFETIDGIPILDVYNNWGPGEPNDGTGVEDCVTLRRDGTLNDDTCFNKYPFICKKSLVSLEWNRACHTPNLDYVLNEQLGRCYKFHLKPSNWTEAYQVCSAELSYLAVINTQSEADFLVKVTASATKDRIAGDFMRGAVLLGFHNKFNEGWQTVRGSALEDSGYARWGNSQPDGNGLEQCGSMFFNGSLNDIACNQKCFFICEHEVDTLFEEFDDRFGDRK